MTVPLDPMAAARAWELKERRQLEQQLPADAGPFTGQVELWKATREALAEMERREHPDVVDEHGRTWVWKGPRGDLYTHDQTLAYPLKWIQEGLNLPPETLSNNWNYHFLCSTCTASWSDEAKAKHAQNAIDFTDHIRLGWDGYRKSRGLT